MRDGIGGLKSRKPSERDNLSKSFGSNCRFNKSPEPCGNSCQRKFEIRAGWSRNWVTQNLPFRTEDILVTGFSCTSSVSFYGIPNEFGIESAEWSKFIPHLKCKGNLIRRWNEVQLCEVLRYELRQRI